MNVSALAGESHDNDTDVLRAVEEGAMGFLLKDTPPKELVRAVRDVAEGRSPRGPKAAPRVVRQMRVRKEGLSPREIEILGLVAEGTPNKEIARELWISEGTVKGHLSRILEKLGAPDRTAAVTYALRLGLIRLSP